MKRVGRAIFRKIYYGPLLCIVILLVLATVAQCMGLASLDCLFLSALGLAFWMWLFLGRLIAHLLVPLLVSTLSCPCCREDIDAVDVWDCACGFHDWRERHILAGRCPMCGKAAGHIDCPRCGCTIGLW